MTDDNSTTVPEGSDHIFSGDVPIQEALRLLRLRLLDLTARNRLLNFKHTPGKSLQFVHSSIDGTYKRLVETQSGRASINPLPEPERPAWILNNGRYTKPDPRDYARLVGIDPSYELEHERPNGPGVTALYYPEDLSKHCRKLYREARLAIEETGANMLFLVFGFLEFPETQDSTKTYPAPLVSVPVSISEAEAEADRHRVKSFLLSILDLTFLCSMRRALLQRPTWKPCAKPSLGVRTGVLEASLRSPCFHSRNAARARP